MLVQLYKRPWDFYSNVMIDGFDSPLDAHGVKLSRGFYGKNLRIWQFLTMGLRRLCSTKLVFPPLLLFFWYFFLRDDSAAYENLNNASVAPCVFFFLVSFLFLRIPHSISSQTHHPRYFHHLQKDVIPTSSFPSPKSLFLTSLLQTTSITYVCTCTYLDTSTNDADFHHPQEKVILFFQDDWGKMEWGR